MNILIDNFTLHLFILKYDNLFLDLSISLSEELFPASFCSHFLRHIRVNIVDTEFVTELNSEVVCIFYIFLNSAQHQIVSSNNFRSEMKRCFKETIKLLEVQKHKIFRQTFERFKRSDIEHKAVIIQLHVQLLVGVKTLQVSLQTSETEKV